MPILNPAGCIHPWCLVDFDFAVFDALSYVLYVVSSENNKDVQSIRYTRVSWCFPLPHVNTTITKTDIRRVRYPFPFPCSTIAQSDNVLCARLWRHPGTFWKEHWQLLSFLQIVPCAQQHGEPISQAMTAIIWLPAMVKILRFFGEKRVLW